MEFKKLAYMRDARTVQIIGLLLLIVGVLAEATPVIVVSFLPLLHGFYREYRLRKTFNYKDTKYK